MSKFLPLQKRRKGSSTSITIAFTASAASIQCTTVNAPSNYTIYLFKGEGTNLPSSFFEQSSIADPALEFYNVADYCLNGPNVTSWFYAELRDSGGTTTLAISNYIQYTNLGISPC